MLPRSRPAAVSETVRLTPPFHPPPPSTSRWSARCELGPLALPVFAEKVFRTRRRPTTSAAFHDPRTQPRIPIPGRMQPTSEEATAPKPSTRPASRTRGRARTGRGRRALRLPRTVPPPEHPSSSPRALEDRERPSQRLVATEAPCSTPPRERTMWSVGTGCLPPTSRPRRSPCAGSDLDSGRPCGQPPLGRRLCHHLERQP